METTVVQGARALARAEILRSIRASARRQLREVGASELSLRAVARELGLASSAIYRYVASRDDLLTELIIEIYDELGEAAEAADAAVTDRDPAVRWRAVSLAIRHWALEHPHDYALVYGSPVPGYAAPRTTVDPAIRVTVVIAGILRDARPAPSSAGAGADLLDAMPGVRALLSSDDPALLLRAAMAWVGVFGAVSFELFGHFAGGITEPAVYFEAAVAQYARDLGI